MVRWTIVPLCYIGSSDSAVIDKLQRLALSPRSNRMKLSAETSTMLERLEGEVRAVALQRQRLDQSIESRETVGEFKHAVGRLIRSSASRESASLRKGN